jgi:uncharacterized membrane protein
VEHTATVAVATDQQRLWRVVANVEAWPRFVSSMQTVRRRELGPLGLGSTALVKQPGMTPTVWEVTEFDDGRAFVWRSTFPGVTTLGGHVVEADVGGSRLTLTFRQSGPLAGVVGLIMGRRIRRFLALEANGLKGAAESPEAA